MSSDKFGSRFGAVLAAAGSAVGLGNVWRFPYIAGQDGGAAFLLLYVFFTALISIPVLIAEFSIGRMSGKPVTSAFSSLAPGGHWGALGFCGMLTAFLIMSYYNIVSGWTLYYSVASVGGWLDGLSESEVAGFFSSLSSDPFRCVIWMLVMLGATAAVVAKCVAGGIEKYSKLLMPLLLVLILLMLVRAVTLDGGLAGLRFFLQPDFSKLTPRAVFDALGQSFFSMSIGMGTMTTYGSYISRKQNLTASAVQVACIDFFVAFLAGAVIFPCVFAFGVNPGQGRGLVFVTLPNIFNQMPYGFVVSTVFFLLLVVAALTSSVSLLEVVVAYFVNSFHFGRRKATVIASFLTMICGLACALSPTVFEIFEKSTANVLMPVGALFIVYFAAHKIDPSQLKAELEAHGAPCRLFPLILFLLKFVIPVAILLIFANGLLNHE